MKSKKKTTSRSSRVRLECEPVPWKFTLTAILFAVLLGFGFFWAANLHFVSMNIGINNNNLRGQIDDLRSKNRRLTLARETALSPQEIRDAARRIGLRNLTVSSLMPVGGDPVFTADQTDGSSAPVQIVKTVIQERSESAPSRADRTAANVPPQTKAVKVTRTVKSAPVKEATIAAAKSDDQKTATRSRIIETVAKR